MRQCRLCSIRSLASTAHQRGLLLTVLVVSIMLPRPLAETPPAGGSDDVYQNEGRQLLQAAACPQRAGIMVRYLEIRNLGTSTCTGTSGGNGGYVLGIKGSAIA